MICEACRRSFIGLARNDSSFYASLIQSIAMRNTRDWLLLLGATALILFSAVMAVRQFVVNQSRHAELREALIFLHSRGYQVEAQRLYTTLVLNLEGEPTSHLIDDLQRTSLVSPTNQSASTNVLVRYHLSIKKELEKRFEQQYIRARETANADS